MPQQPVYRRSRPALRRATGSPEIADAVTWTRIVEPHKRYRIIYQDRDGSQNIRELELSKVGESK